MTEGVLEIRPLVTILPLLHKHKQGAFGLEILFQIHFYGDY